jgi:hypothetical protein
MESVVSVELEDKQKLIMKAGNLVCILKMNAMIELIMIDLIQLGDYRKIDSANVINIVREDKKEREF